MTGRASASLARAVPRTGSRASQARASPAGTLLPRLARCRRTGASDDSPPRPRPASGRSGERPSARRTSNRPARSVWNSAIGFPTCLSPAKTVNVVLASGERCALTFHSSISSRVIATPPRKRPCARITRSPYSHPPDARRVHRHRSHGHHQRRRQRDSHHRPWQLSHSAGVGCPRGYAFGGLAGGSPDRAPCTSPSTAPPRGWRNAAREGDRAAHRRRRGARHQLSRGHVGHLLGRAWWASPPFRVEAGDIIVFPQGDPHVLSSEPGMRGQPDAGGLPGGQPADRSALPVAARRRPAGARRSSAVFSAATRARSIPCWPLCLA